MISSSILGMSTYNHIFCMYDMYYNMYTCLTSFDIVFCIYVWHYSSSRSYVWHCSNTMALYLYMY